MKRRVLLAVTVLLLASMACVSQAVASNVSALPVTKTPTAEILPVTPTATQHIITVASGKTYHIRDANGVVVGYAYSGDTFQVESITGNWYKLITGNYIHVGCCQ